MTDAATRAADLLIEQRGHIDNLDAILIYTLAERFKATDCKSAGRRRHRFESCLSHRAKVR